MLGWAIISTRMLNPHSARKAPGQAVFSLRVVRQIFTLPSLYAMLIIDYTFSGGKPFPGEQEGEDYITQAARNQYGKD